MSVEVWGRASIVLVVVLVIGRRAGARFFATAPSYLAGGESG